MFITTLNIHNIATYVNPNVAQGNQCSINSKCNGLEVTNSIQPKCQLILVMCSRIVQSVQ
jgi:hypothetical protein